MSKATKHGGTSMPTCYFIHCAQFSLAP